MPPRSSSSTPLDGVKPTLARRGSPRARSRTSAMRARRRRGPRRDRSPRPASRARAGRPTARRRCGSSRRRMGARDRDRARRSASAWRVLVCRAPPPASTPNARRRSRPARRADLDRRGAARRLGRVRPTRGSRSPDRSSRGRRHAREAQRGQIADLLGASSRCASAAAPGGAKPCERSSGIAVPFGSRLGRSCTVRTNGTSASSSVSSLLPRYVQALPATGGARLERHHLARDRQLAIRVGDRRAERRDRHAADRAQHRRAQRQLRSQRPLDRDRVIAAALGAQRAACRRRARRSAGSHGSRVVVVGR